jgi:hypothetical protein
LIRKTKSESEKHLRRVKAAQRLQGGDRLRLVAPWLVIRFQLKWHRET